MQNSQEKDSAEHLPDERRSDGSLPNKNLSNINRKMQSGNLILVGMMGSGKTTMGRALARHLGKSFVDSDEEIIKRTGVTVPHIFDIEGESGFRLRETAIIHDLVGRENTTPYGPMSLQIRQKLTRGQNPCRCLLQCRKSHLYPYQG